MKKSPFIEKMDTISIIKHIALNYADYDQILSIVNSDAHFQVIGGTSYNPWNTTCLSHGIPGICMLHAELDAHFPEEGWDKVGHQYLSILVSEISSKGIQSPSMFSGGAGIGLATACLSKGFTQYSKLLHSINEYMHEAVTAKIDEAKNRQNHMGDYDVIEGISGIANYLLLYKHEKKMRELLINSLKYLVNISEDIDYQGRKVPGWLIPSECHFTKEESEYYSNGSFNLGLSHGISGIVAVLSIALMEEVEVSGQRAAIKKMVDFLLQFANKEDNFLFWKGAISFEEYLTGGPYDRVDFRRDAWCYGNPGICLSMLYAGVALKIPEYSNVAIKNMLKSAENIPGIFSPTICHGLTGISQILLTANKLADGQYFDKEISILNKQILAFYDDAYPLGFHNYEAFGESDAVPLNFIGLLDGAAGVCLTLLSCELGTKTEWKRAFLL